jgi:hypothetical protein
MEFAAAALSSIAEAGAGIGSSIATAATGPAGIFGLGQFIPGAGTAASILGGGATVLSVLNAQRAGEAKSMALNASADDAMTQTQIEALQGLDRRTSLKAAMVQHIGERDVATAASGTDISFGTPTIARAQAIKDGERAASIDADTTETRIARLRERAANYRIQAAQASAGGLGTAAALALDGGAKILKRG